MRYLTALLTALGLALAVLPAPASAAGDPLTCVGYPEPRVFMEAQSWWGFERGIFARLGQAPDTGNAFGHGHLGACVPLDNPSYPVTGVMQVDFVVKLHQNPGSIRKIEAEISDADGDVGLHSLYTGGSTVTCPTDCTKIIPTTFDTRLSRYDGRVGFQPRVIIDEPDGNFMRPSLRFPFYVRNGKTTKDNVSSTNVPLGYGWYGPTNSNAGYTWARLDSGVPQAPVSGLYTLKASFLSDGGGFNTTYYRIAVDPDIHAGLLGTIVTEARTSCTPGGSGCSGPRKAFFTIDTRTLSNGVHKVMLLSDAKDVVRADTNSGIFVFPITVAN